MRLRNWFISNLDDSQRQIIVQDPDKSLIVQGPAGSGKTNLAIHRAQQASAFGSYVVIVYTVALKKMVQFGLQSLGLDKDRVVYEWSWDHRGIEVSGEVFCLAGTNKYELNPDVLIVTEDSRVRFFIARDKYESAVANSTYESYQIETVENPLEISIDFGDWVADKFYYTFYRRERWFKEVHFENLNFEPLDNKYIYIPSAFIFKKKEPVDYMIIDEAQDFSLTDFTHKFKADVNKSLTLLGDTQQKIYDNRGVSLDEIQAQLLFPRYLLTYNYRLPKSIAKVAQVVSSPHQDLLSNNRKNQGNSDFPIFSKPVIRRLASRKLELEFIIRTINMESLDDVAILVPENDDIKFVHDFFNGKNIDTQVRYTVDLPENRMAGRYPMFRLIDSLDFSNNDLPCILTYHSAKGTEFDNVFLPFANDGDLRSRSAFYVATSRASSRLTITYSNNKTGFLKDVQATDVVELT